MNKAVRMLLVLSAITVVSGGALGSLYEQTYELAENNILRFKKIPAVVSIHQGLLEEELSEEARIALEEKLLVEKRQVEIGERQSLLFFVIEKDGKPHAAALEAYGQGFGGKLGVMAGFALEGDELVGMGVTTMSETPGLGTRVREAAFAEQFVGLPKETVLKIKKDGGELDAVTGATVSSRAVVAALQSAREIFAKHKSVIVPAANQPPVVQEKAP